MVSETSTSSDVLVNVPAWIFSNIPTLLRRLELHRQLTHQPDYDRIFSKPFSPTFSFAVAVLLSSNLLMSRTFAFLRRHIYTGSHQQSTNGERSEQLVDFKTQTFDNLTYAAISYASNASSFLMVPGGRGYSLIRGREAG